MLYSYVNKRCWPVFVLYFQWILADHRFLDPNLVLFRTELILRKLSCDEIFTGLHANAHMLRTFGQIAHNT